MQLIKAMPPAAARPCRKAVGKDQKIDKAAIMPEVATPNARIDSTGKPRAITRKTRPAPAHRRAADDMPTDSASVGPCRGAALRWEINGRGPKDSTTLIG